MSVPHPIPYQGSKRMLAGSILSFFPGQIDRLVEPFAGSAAVSLAAAFHRKARRFLLNDLNKPLMGLWQEIIQDPDGLADRYRRIWEEQGDREKDHFFAIRAKFNKDPRPEYFLFLLTRCAKATIRYNGRGEFNNSPDNRRRGTHPDTMTESLRQASRLLRGRTELLSVDYRQLESLLRRGDLVYMDPPYQGVCKDRDPRYLSGVTFDEFVAFLERLNSRAIAFIVSYDGRTGDKTYGRKLPASLGLRHIEIDAGRSSQATLLGADARTYESLYLSPGLSESVATLRVGEPLKASRAYTVQLPLFG